MKKCSKCGIVKPKVEFSKCARHKDGLSSRCKSCAKLYYTMYYKHNKDKVAHANKQWRKENPTKDRQYHLRRKYGLTTDEHKQMYMNQNCCCAVCGKPLPYQDVYTDHDHQTGVVRGLVCNSCNWLLSFVDRDPTIWDKAISYIAQYGART